MIKLISSPRIDALFAENMHLYSLLGPLFLLISLLIVQGKIPELANFFALPAISGLAIIWLFRKRGIFIALALLLVSVLYFFIYHPLPNVTLVVLFLATVTASFATAAFCAAEIDAFLMHWRQEIHSTKEKMAFLDAKWRETYGSLQGEVQGLRTADLPRPSDSHVLPLEARIVELEEELQTLGEQKEQLQAVNFSFEEKEGAFLKELEEKKLLLLQREEGATLLQEQVIEQQKRLEAAEKAWLHADKALEQCQKALRDSYREKEEALSAAFAWQSAVAQETRESIVELASDEAEKDQSDEAVAAELPDEAMNMLMEEKRQLRISQGMLQQLKEQFREKSMLLDKTRRELFFAEEEASRLLKEKEDALEQQQETFYVAYAKLLSSCAEELEYESCTD
jgi:hypothetical protein